MTTALVKTRPRVRIACASCHLEITDERREHMCPDQLRSAAFEGYLEACVEYVDATRGRLRGDRVVQLGAELRMAFCWEHARPWEREILEQILMRAANRELLARAPSKGLPS